MDSLTDLVRYVTLVALVCATAGMLKFYWSMPRTQMPKMVFVAVILSSVALGSSVYENLVSEDPFNWWETPPTLAYSVLIIVATFKFLGWRRHG